MGRPLPFAHQPVDRRQAPEFFPTTAASARFPLPTCFLYSDQLKPETMVPAILRGAYEEKPIHRRADRQDGNAVVSPETVWGLHALPT